MLSDPSPGHAGLANVPTTGNTALCGPSYILDAAAQDFTMIYVRVHRMNNGRFRVFEGLTNR